MKLLILILSLALMVAVLGLAVAGFVWYGDAPDATRASGRFALSLGGVGAVVGLFMIWKGRSSRVH